MVKISKPAKEKQPNPTIKRIDVTNMKPNKRRSIFIDYMDRNSFAGFTVQRQNNQTYYTFAYYSKK